jgi:hypothetical protein
LETARVFEGRVYFDFTEPAVWRFYRFLTAAARGGAELRLDWRPFMADPGNETGLAALASYEAVRDQHVDRHGAYLQALLSLHHLDAAHLAADQTLRTAAESAGVPESVPLGWGEYRESVLTSTGEGHALGVTATPSLYRHGPVMRVDVNPAAYEGDVTGRLRVIELVLEDDGIWGLVKP